MKRRYHPPKAGRDDATSTFREAARQRGLPAAYIDKLDRVETRD